jgi:WD40 repeat protein
VAGAVQQHKLYQQEMRVWFAQQYTKCRAGASLLPPVQIVMQLEQQQQQQLPPHLLGYTPSLVQAGGMHRMALRGHLGPIRKVVIAPDGKDVLTASDDGTVQVGASKVLVLWAWSVREGLKLRCQAAGVLQYQL